MAQDEKPLKFFIEPLGPKHDRAAFSCGDEALDNYLHNQAGQDLKKHVAVPFVLTHDAKRIAGYYTLSQFAVALDEVPAEIAKKLPRYPMLSPQEPTAGSWGPRVPATLLGRLAISKEFQGQKLGELLLMDALKRSLDTSKQLASAAVVVDAKDDAAIAFYKKYGFLDLPKIKRRLFLPMGTIERLFVIE